MILKNENITIDFLKKEIVKKIDLDNLIGKPFTEELINKINEKINEGLLVFNVFGDIENNTLKIKFLGIKNWR